MKQYSLVLAALTVIILSNFHCKSEKNEDAPPRYSKQDRIDLAVQQDFMKRRDPRLDVVPVERLEEARQYMQQAVTARNIAALTWQERGPSNVGGRSRAMIIDKADASGNTVIAASVSGGVFRTTNYTNAGGPTWTAINDFLPNIAINSMVQDPVNLNVMYAGTGEGWFNIDAVRGRGIYKSTNGGLNWTVLPSTIVTTPADLTFEYVQDLAIGTNGALYATTRNLTSSIRGVQRSTDGGNTWTQVLGAPLTTPIVFNTGRATDLEVASNGDVYASLGMVGANFANRSVVLKSSFATHGANTGALGTWENITPVRGLVTQRTEIILAPSDPQRVYLLMQDSATREVKGTYRSFNGGASWDSVASASALNGSAPQTWYNLIGAVDPNNADVLVVGGLHIGKSTNAGVSWTTISSGQVHVDHHFLEYKGSNILYNGNDGGAYYTANANATTPGFSNKNSGYNVTQFYSCAVHPTDANYFLAGSQDNGTQKFTQPGINPTSAAVGGDGGFCHIDQDNPQFQIAATVFNNIYRSTNGGASFSYLNTVSNGRGQFINPTDYDDAGNTLYCGDDAGRYYIITNIGGTPSSIVANVSAMGSRELTAVKVDPFAANTIWVGASGGAPMVLKISNSVSASPTVVTSFTFTAGIGVPTGAYLSSVDVDPANANHIVATFSNFGVNSVFESTNGGTSFTSIEGNLPDMPVYWALFAPANAQLSGTSGGLGGILLGTDLGVWTTSAIAGASTQWIANNSGLANVRTDMLQYRPMDNLVAAGTHGRGLFTTILPTVVTGLPNDPPTKDFIKYVYTEGGSLRIVKGNLLTQTMTLQLFDMNGRLVYNSKKPYQDTSIPLFTLQKGSYIIRITGNNREHFVKQFILAN
jgi:hypothetical protein